MSLERFPVSRAKAILQHLNCVIMWEHHSWIHKLFRLQRSSDHESNMSLEDSSEESLMRLKLCTHFHELKFNISTQRWSCYTYYVTLTFIRVLNCPVALESPSDSSLNVYIVLLKPIFWMKSCMFLLNRTNTYMKMHATCTFIFMWFMMAVRFLQRQSKVLSKNPHHSGLCFIEEFKNRLKRAKI